ncbi:MAG: cation-transporting P-type ATPase, partial [Rhodoferax sp.]|nr:cation-transporting P-type ATPase [Rhodoferax sp.]
MAGLTPSEAAERLKQWGANRLTPAPQRAVLWQFLAQFRNPLVLVLLVAIVISALTGDVTGALIIGLIVVISVTLDFVQSYRAGRAAEQLAQQVAVVATVLRGGSACEVPVMELVPGDVVLLSAGNLIPADAHLLQANDFFVNQAQLTGEPYPVEKRAITPRKGVPEDWSLDAPDTVFMGSSVVSGSAKVLIGRTGSRTALGQIAVSLAQDAPPTAFEVGTRQFGVLIMRLTLLLVLFTLLVNVALQRSLLESFLFAVALAVGLTPSEAAERLKQ